MFRVLRPLVLIFFGIVLIVGIAFGGGYLAAWTKMQPLSRLAERVEDEWNQISGGPTETERRADVLETTFLRLRGTVYEMPENDWSNGGAMTVWGDDLLVVHRTGRILRFVEGRGLVDTEIGAAEAGMAAYKALARGPEYANYTHKPNSMRFNDILYVDDPAASQGLALSYTFFDPEEVCYGTRVAWLPLAEGAADAATLTASSDDWEVIFESKPCLSLNSAWTALDGIMAGGRMAYKAPGKLILGSGEYHLDGVHTHDVGIQSDKTDYGKVIEIDLATRETRHLSKGHRNLQGLAIDGQGRIWTVEHGVRGGDELNLIREGRNYGWPLETLGTLYSGQPFPVEGDQGRHLRYEAPIYAWLPSAAVSSLAVIEGFDPTWDGDLLVGSLSSEEFGQSLFRIRIRDGRAMIVERIKLGRRIRYVMQYGARLALWLDTNELVLLSIEPRLDPLAEVVAALDARHEADLAGRIKRQLRSCGECHSYVQSNHAGAPSLNGVFERPIGSTGYKAYSDALANHGGVWDAEALRAFLLDPQGFAPGTAMPASGISDDAMLDGLIWALENIDTTDDAHLKYN